MISLILLHIYTQPLSHGPDVTQSQFLNRAGMNKEISIS